MSSSAVTIRTHHQLSESARRRIVADQNTRGTQGRHRPNYRFQVPEWLSPKNGVHIWKTITASIIWGLAGAMSDMDEEQRGLGWTTQWYGK